MLKLLKTLIQNNTVKAKNGIKIQNQDSGNYIIEIQFTS